MSPPFHALTLFLSPTSTLAASKPSLVLVPGASPDRAGGGRQEGNPACCPGARCTTPGSARVWFGDGHIALGSMTWIQYAKCLHTYRLIFD